MIVFWDVAPCDLVDVDRRLRSAYCLTEEVSSSETSVSICQTTLHTGRRGNLKAHKEVCLSRYSATRLRVKPSVCGIQDRSLTSTVTCSISNVGKSYCMDFFYIWCEGVEWIQLAQDRVQCRVVVNTVGLMYLRVPYKAENLLVI
jgi:hypothetical protein